MADKQAQIDQGIRRLEWVQEDLGVYASKTITAIIEVAPVLREQHPDEVLRLINVFSNAFYNGIDDVIAENDAEAEEM